MKNYFKNLLWPSLRQITDCAVVISFRKSGFHSQEQINGFIEGVSIFNDILYDPSYCLAVGGRNNTGWLDQKP